MAITHIVTGSFIAKDSRHLLVYGYDTTGIDKGRLRWIIQVMSHESETAVEIYARRLIHARSDLDRESRRDMRMGNARVAVFFGALLTLLLASGFHLYPAAWAAVPTLFCGIQIVLHNRIAEALEAARRKVEFYEQGVRRLTDTWAGHGDTGLRYLDPSHPYAPDLDLFGDGSLYQLLCTTRTRAGDDCLARWLLCPANRSTILDRQAAVQELAPHLDLRQTLALEIRSSSEQVSPEGLSAWGEAPALHVPPIRRAAAGVLAAFNIAAVTYMAVAHAAIPFAISIVATVLFQLKYARWMKTTMATTGQANRCLENFAILLRLIEQEPADSTCVVAIKQRLKGDGDVSASEQIARFQKLTGLLEATNNQMFLPLSYMLLWTFQCSALIEQWRAVNGPCLREWLDASGEFEAICALANFAFENPASCYPKIFPGEPRMLSSGLAHPLLARTSRIANDVAIGDPHRLLIVSGSNMSGKSTLLRTIGVNCVLAMSGGPVIARSMTLSPMQIGASIRTLDSLQDGISRFYAEIKRIRQIVDLTHIAMPVLFLMDEILHGTNSHDRQIGAEAIVRSLLGAGAVGLVTTHDLALARLANDDALHARNVHFEDQLSDRGMEFDYCLKDGIVEKSNAIALMRAVGLEV